MELRFAAASDCGRVRPHNEDRFVANGDLRFFLVADGMGGAVAGELASSSIAETTTAFIRDTVDDRDRTWPFGLDPKLSLAANRLQVAIRGANRALGAMVQGDATLSGTGATLAAALFADSQVSVANVGDCRAYLLRGGALTQITQDHSLVAEQVALGLLNAEEARRHPLRHVVTRAVSGDASMVVDIQELAILPSDRLLLCSDGIHGAFTDEELATIIAPADAGMEETCRELIAQANARGGADNATVILIEAGGAAT